MLLIAYLRVVDSRQGLNRDLTGPNGERATEQQSKGVGMQSSWVTSGPEFLRLRGAAWSLRRRREVHEEQRTKYEVRRRGCGDAWWCYTADSRYWIRRASELRSAGDTSSGQACRLSAGLRVATLLSVPGIVTSSHCLESRFWLFTLSVQAVEVYLIRRLRLRLRL